MAIEMLERAPNSDDWVYKVVSSRIEWELERYREDKSIEELNRAIEEYVARGFSIIPLINGGKLSLKKWGEYQKRQASADEIFDWCIEYGNFNLGIVTGEISKLIVIDCDSSEQRWILRKCIPEASQTAVSRTKRGFHYYFKTNGERIGTQRILVNEVAGGIELKGEGSYVVAPPSTVEGVKREWLVGLEHLQQIPESLLKLLKIQQEYKQEQTQTAVWRYKGEASCISQILQRDIQKGERDISLFILYNLLIRGGNSSEYARKLVERKNTMLREPLSEKELEYVFRKDYNGLGCNYVTSNLGWIDCEGCKFARRREKMSLWRLYKAHEQGLIDLDNVNIKVFLYLATRDLLDNPEELNKKEISLKIGVGRATVYRTLQELAKLK